MGRSHGPLPPTFRRRDQNVVVSDVTQVGDQVRLPEPPSASVGTPIPYISGTQLIKQPNLVWIGNLRPITETVTEVEEVCEDVREPVRDIQGNIQYFNTFKRCEQSITNTVNTVGYLVGMQFGICLGPGVRLRRIIYQNETVWTGTLGPDFSTTLMSVFGNSPFRGSTLRFYGGGFDQTPDSYLAQFTPTGQLPGYPGICYVVFEGVRYDELEGDIQFEVDRFPNPFNQLPLSGWNTINNVDLNIASAVADFIDSDWGGAGIGLSNVDTTSFEASGDLLHTEGNGCSLYVVGGSTVNQIFELLAAQAYAFIYEDPALRQIAMKLIRFESLSISGSVFLNDSNISNVNEWSKTAWLLTSNRVRINFFNRDKTYEEDSILGYNFSSINEQLTKDRTAVLDYPFVYSAEIAGELLTRDITFFGSPISYVELEVNRQASRLLPGDGVQVFAPNQGIQPIFGIVEKVRRTDLKSNKVIVEVREVQRLDDALNFGTPETSNAAAIEVNVVEPAGGRAISAPYWYARRNGITLIETYEAATTLPMFLVAPANNVQTNFDVDQTNDPDVTGLLRVIDNAGYATSATLDTAISKYDGWTTGDLTSIQVSGVTNDIWLQNDPGADGAARGDVLIFINDEIFTFQTVTGPVDGVYTINNLERAVLDTVAQAHTAGDDVYIFSGKDASILPDGAFDFPVSPVPSWRVTSNTGLFAGNNTDPDQYISFAGWNPAANRLRAPLRPHLLQIDGARPDDTDPILISINTSFDATWRVRSREQLSITYTDGASETAENDGENFASYRVNVIDSAGIVRSCGETANDNTYNSLTATIPGSTIQGGGFLFVEARFGTNASIFRDTIPVVVFVTAIIISETLADTAYMTEDETAYYVGEQ